MPSTQDILYKAIYFAILMQHKDTSVYHDYETAKNVSLAFGSNYTDIQAATFVMNKYREMWEYSYCKDIIQVMRISIYSVGLIGYIFDVVLLQASQFKLVTFTYHRCLAVMEIIHGTGQICKSCYYVLMWNYPEYTWVAYFWSTAAFINEPVGWMAECVVMVMTFERFVALTFVTHYGRINRKFVAVGSICTCICMGLLKCENGLSYYITTNPDGTADWHVPTWYNGDFTTLFETALNRVSTFVNVSNFALTLGVIYALRKWGKKRAEMEMLDDYKMSQQLTYLCMACAIPFNITAIFNTVNDYMFSPYVSEYISADKFLNPKNPYPTVEWAQSLKFQYNYFYVALCFTWFFGHASHCYFYFSFSSLFRQAANKLLCCGKDTDTDNVGSTSNNTSKMFVSRSTHK